MHADAPSYADTDWREILGLYGLLERITGNPMVTLNRAIAAAMKYVDHGESDLERLDAERAAEARRVVRS